MIGVRADKRRACDAIVLDAWSYLVGPCGAFGLLVYVETIC